MLKNIIFVILIFNISSMIRAQSGVKAGDKAPSISVEEWLKGEPVNSFENDKVYLVEFWGTWCGPCIENIPHLSELQKKYSDRGLVVIGVATHEFDGRTKLDKFMTERGSEMEYTVAFDTDLSMQRDWDTGESGEDKFRLPVCFIVDKTGKVVFTGHPADIKLEDMIESALN